MIEGSQGGGGAHHTKARAYGACFLSVPSPSASCGLHFPSPESPPLKTHICPSPFVALLLENLAQGHQCLVFTDPDLSARIVVHPWGPNEKACEGSSAWSWFGGVCRQAEILWGM